MEPLGPVAAVPEADSPVAINPSQLPQKTRGDRGFLRIRGTILGVPIIRILEYWGPYWGLLILGNYHICIMWGPPKKKRYTVYQTF